MEDFNLNYQTGDKPAAGKLLISEPFMGDQNFNRSVVLICEHDNEVGTFGLVLNKELNLTLTDAVPNLHNFDTPLFFGGPVQQDTLHFVHKRKDLFEDCGTIMEGIYWSGDFELLKEMISTGEIREDEIRFFLGYSGWDVGQLEQEIKDDSWIITDSSIPIVFEMNPDLLWKYVLEDLGGNFKVMANFPTDPIFN